MAPVSDIEINDSEMVADSMPPSKPDNSDCPCAQATWTARMHQKLKGSLYRHYQQKCIESKGFDVSGCTGVLPGGIVPLVLDGCAPLSDFEGNSTMVEAVLCAQFAVKTYNDKVTSEDAMKGGIQKRSTLKFLEIARASWQLVAGSLYYITLWARETETGQEKLYRAKVWKKVVRQGMEVDYFEEAPVSDQENPNLRRQSRDDPKELVESEVLGPITHKNPHPFTWEADRLCRMAKKSIEKAGHSTRSKRSRMAKKSIEKAGHSTRRSKRPFNVFFEEVRKSPELSKKDYNQIMSSAKSKWKMLSDKDSSIL